MGTAFDRDPRAAAGTARQMAAILKSGNRTAELGRIKAPTLVISGSQDGATPPEAARVYPLFGPSNRGRRARLGKLAGDLQASERER